MRPKLAIALVCAALSAACTTLPNVTAPYRLPRADVTVTATRTIGCNAPATAGAPPIVRILYMTSAVVSTVAYSADPAQSARATVNIAALNGPLSEGSLALDYYDDGRLKGVNSQTTGQGSAIIQAVANLVPLLAASTSDLSPSAGRNAQMQIDAICAAFDRVSIDGKPVTMIYEHSEDFAQRRPDQKLNEPLPTNCRLPDADTASDCVVAPTRLIPLAGRASPRVGGDELLVDLNNVLPRLCVSFGDPVASDTVPVWTEGGGHHVRLRLRRPARYSMQVYQKPANPSADDAYCLPPTDRTILWSGSALVPLTEAASLAEVGNAGEYALPVPRGAPFGTNNFKLAVAESGVVTALSYGNTSGAAAAIGAVTAIGSAAIDTDAEKADRIAQQQRLIRCQQDPSTCE